MNAKFPQRDDFSILGMLLVIRKNLKLLIAGPLFALIVAFVVTSIGPQKYVSKASILLPAPLPPPGQVAELLKTESILGSITYTKDPVQVEVRASQYELTRNQIKTIVGKNGFLHIEVSATTARGAQELGSALIDGWLKSTEPSSLERKNLEQRLLLAETNLNSISNVLTKVKLHEGTLIEKTSNRLLAIQNLVELHKLQSLYLQEMQHTTNALAGLPKKIIVQSPTLPTKPERNNEVVLYPLCVSFVIFVFVFLRQTWRTSAAGLDSAQ